MLIAATGQAIGVPAQTISAVTDFSVDSRSRHSSADSSVDVSVYSSVLYQGLYIICSIIKSLCL